jgi:hypothetical protein
MGRLTDGTHIDQHPRSLSLFSLFFLIFAMPRLIILPPPGGVSGVQRRHYTAREKIAILSQIRHVKQETGVSNWAAAESVGILHMLVIHRHTLHERFNNIDIKQLPCYSGHDGPCGQLEDVNEALLAWIFERREMGVTILMYSVVIQACTLLPLMEQKSFMVQWMVIRRFLNNHSIVHQLGTKVSQRYLGKLI